MDRSIVRIVRFFHRVPKLLAPCVGKEQQSGGHCDHVISECFLSPVCWIDRECLEGARQGFSNLLLDPPIPRVIIIARSGYAFGPFLGVIGGPCSVAAVACLNEGPNRGMLCGGSGVADDAFCDSAPGAGDGSCDACPVHGGVTTTDEMMILLGTFFMAPEPSAALLGAAALATLGAVARRRRSA